MIWEWGRGGVSFTVCSGRMLWGMDGRDCVCGFVCVGGGWSGVRGEKKATKEERTEGEKPSGEGGPESRTDLVG